MHSWVDIAHEFTSPLTYPQSCLISIKIIVITLPTRLCPHEPKKFGLPETVFFFLLKIFYAVVDNVLSANNSKSWTAVSEKVSATIILHIFVE